MRGMKLGSHHPLPCPWLWMLVLAILHHLVDVDASIPTTLDGPFQPITVSFDASLRTGSDDLPHSHPRLVKRVPSIFPEQIALALSEPGSMWVSWITGTLVSIMTTRVSFIVKLI
jgi:hypothetical protein